MFISRFNSLAALALGLSSIFAPPTVFVSAQLAECSTSTDSAYTYEVSPEDGFVIFWSVDTTAETVSMKVEYTGLAWAAVGFSADGMMVGSDAVIGLPDDQTVLEYDLADKSSYAVLEYSTQELEDVSVSQDATTSVMFTRLLTPADSTKEIISATPGDETILIWAYGFSNTLEQHDMTARGSVTLDVFCGSDGAATGSTPAPSASGDPMMPQSTIVPFSASPIFVGTYPPAPGGGSVPPGKSAAPTVTGGGGGPPGMESLAPTATGGGLGPPRMESSAPTAIGGGRNPPETATSAPAAAPIENPAAAETPAPATDRGLPDGTTAPTATPSVATMVPVVSATPSPGSTADDQQTGTGFRVVGGGDGVWVAGVASGVAVLLGWGAMLAW